MENLLYYPYIDIPRTDWTARTLLYYDRIGSIVPNSYRHNPDNYDPFMRELIQNELVEEINPLDVLDSPHAVAGPFINYVKSKDLDIEKRQKQFSKENSFDSVKKRGFVRETRIHAQKFDHEVFYALMQNGLAENLHNGWYRIERKTADELMAFLASVIGTKLQYQPVTDVMRKRYRLAHSTKTEYESYKVQNERRERILNELIPFPQEIDIVKLKKFKEKHYEILKVFKNKIELLVLNSQIEESSLLFTESIRELQFRKHELSAKMNESKFGPIFYGTVCGIFSAIAGISTADTLAALAIGFPGFVGAIYAALKIEHAEGLFDQSGMKYLALVDKRLRTSKSTR